MNKTAKELAGISKKLQNEDFLNKAPENIVEKVKEKHEVLVEKQNKLRTNFERIAELRAE
jgi:valyl-tRNA synthetase